MIRKTIIATLAGLALMISVASVTFAQTGELRGHVVMEQAGAAPTPLSDAIIDVYRTDISGKYNTKTNKKGEFVFAGLPFVGTYLVVASHPTAQFGWVPNVKVGRGVDYEIKVTPGSGKRPTADEVKAMEKQGGGAAGGGGNASTSESAADKAKREEALRKNAEIDATNKKIEESNAVVSRTFTAGNAALLAKNYDEAIKLYDEGIGADADHPARPVLLTQRAQALKARGVVKYNAAIVLKEDAAKTSGLEAARADFKAAAESSKKAVDIFKAQTAPTDVQQQANFTANRLAALQTNAESTRLFVTKVDQSQVEMGQTAYQDYMAAELDPARKVSAQRELALMLFDASAFEKALAEYKKILDANPDDTDALLKSGMALFNIGAINNNDKTKYQEAANYLQQFVNKAPDTDKYKSDAQAILDNLKEQQNVKAEKTAAPPRRRRP